MDKVPKRGGSPSLDGVRERPTHRPRPGLTTKDGVQNGVGEAKDPAAGCRAAKDGKSTDAGEFSGSGETSGPEGALSANRRPGGLGAGDDGAPGKDPPLTLTAEALQGKMMMTFRPECPVPDSVRVPRPPVAQPPPDGGHPVHSGLAGAQDISRYLVGRVPEGHQARVTLASGPLAGLELVVLASRSGIAASLLTPRGTTRQTQTVAFHELRRRLASRGIELEMNDSEAQPASGADVPADEPRRRGRVDPWGAP